jgi:hypothetical protein
MLPAFDANGYLPPGIHRATLGEVTDRFGRQSELRRVQMESLHWLIDLARRAGVRRFIINGSFTTDVDEPNDVDCVLLMDPNFPKNSEAEFEITKGIPFLEVHLVEPQDFAFYVEKLYASDRIFVPKGMVEVIL